MLGQKIGALWKKVSKEKQMTFYSGTIDTMFGKIHITVFKNDKKEKDNQPDLNIVFNGVESYEKKDRATTTREDDIFDQGFDSGHADNIPEDVFNDSKPTVEGAGYTGDVNVPTIEL